MGDSDAPRSTGGRTAATALLSNPAAPSPRPDETKDLTPEEDAAHATLAPGARIGRFSVLATLGAGGMGVVYAAYDPELDRRVAIKLLGHKGERSREANLRLLREAQAMARLSHPNVVSVYDVGQLDDATVFLAMEFVEGMTFDRWLASAPRTWRQVRDVLVQAGRGLAAAHRTGLVHRDFKPGNLLVDGDGRARVTDFGIARLDETDDAAAAAAAPVAALASGVTPLAIDLTRTGTAIGTPAYMSPEQHRGQPVDARADQFAFCVTMWEAVYGERPFSGKGVALLEQVRAGPPALGTEARPSASARDVRGAPAWLPAVLRRGLADAPSARWPTIDALVDKIADDPAARRRKRLALGGVVAGVAAIAAGAAVIVTRDDKDACAATARAIDGTWNKSVAAAAHTAFAATGSPLAADHWPRVATRLDAWTASWRAARTDACEQHEARAQSDDLYDRRVACLERQRASVSALVDLLRAPDAAVVRESVMVAAGLRPPEDCADVEALLGQRPLPAEPAVRAQVATFRGEIERVNMIRTFGRYAEALGLVKTLRDRARPLGYQPLDAELTFGVGMLMTDVSDAEAEPTLREAAALAATARDTKLYAKTWSSLVWEVGFKRQRFDDAKPLRELAWQSVHLAGDDPSQVAQLEMHEGAVLFAHGDYAEAGALLERAVGRIEKKSGVDSVHLVAALNLLAVIRGGKEPEVAAALYTRAKTILEKTVSPQHPRVASLIGALAGIEYGQGRFDESIALHRKALALLEAAFGPDSAELATELNNLAQPLWALNKFDEAYPLIDRARVLWEQKLGADHPYVATALMNLGGLRQEQGRCKEALPLLEKAKAIHDKKLPKGHRSTVLRYVFTGGCLIDLGRPAEALPILEEALAMQMKGGGPVDQAGAKFEIARARWALGDKRTALAMAEAARVVLAADPQDKVVAASGAKSGSMEAAEWLKGKKP